MKEITLGKACILKSGKFISASEIQEQPAEGLYPCYGGNGIRGYISEYSHDGHFPLIGRQGALCGNVNYASGKFRATEHAVVVQPVEEIDTRWLYYKLIAMNLGQYATGAAQPGLAVNKLEQLPICIPSLAEQKQTAKAFDKIEALIALRKEQLAKLDKLVKARFVEMFGDPVGNLKNYLVKSLQELIDMGYITYHLDGNHGGDYPRSEEFVENGVPYIGANSIVNGEVDFAKAKYLTVERAGKLHKGIAKNEDVLFAHNATVGPVVVLHTTEPMVILSTSLTAYRCNKNGLLPNYLKAYMQSDGFVHQYADEMKQTTRNQVPITAQKKYLFLIPPVIEQEQFAVFVEQTNKTKLTIQASLDKLEVMKKALMQEYFG